jgi:hypothetical protein
MSNENTQLAIQPETSAAMTLPSMGEMLFDDAKFERMNQVANLMASGKCAVPKHLQNNPGDCFAIIVQAAQWRMNPFVVAQKTHIVNGALGYEAQLINAVITSMNVTKDRFHYEYVGDWDAYRKSGFAKAKEVGCGVNVGATLKGENEIRWMPLPLYMESVRTRNSPLWSTNPQQQLGYLAVKYWVRLYAPDAILGVYSDDELAVTEPAPIMPADVIEEENTAPKARKSKADKLAEKLGVKSAAAPVVDAEEVPSTPAEDLLNAASVNYTPAAKTVTERIEEAIAQTQAPISVAEVEMYMAGRGLFDGYGLDDLDRYPENWRNRMQGDLSDLVNKAAEWILNNK